MIKAIVGTSGNLQATVTVGEKLILPTLQNKSIKPTTTNQEVVFDIGYDGLGIVEVLGVDASIDENIKSQYIMQGVNILGVKGSLEAENIPLLYFYNGNTLCREASKEVAEFILKHLGGFVYSSAGMREFFYKSGIGPVEINRDYDFSNVKDFSYFFSDCKNLTRFSGTGKFKMSSCTTLAYLFRSSAVEYIDFSVFDISTCTSPISFSWSFNQCSNLKELVNLDITLGTNVNTSFLNGCVLLEKLSFKEGSQICSTVEADHTLVLTYCSKLTDAAVYEMLSSLGVNTTGYIRTIEFARSVYAGLSENTKSLAESKGYTLK